MDAKSSAQRMVQRQLRERGIVDERVLEAMERVPRHRFVPEEDIERAYSDHALGLEQGQTISQPYVVARMSELLRVEPGHRVLEVGTGSGYQTAVLAEMGAKVISIERYPELAARARRVLTEIMPETAIDIVLGDGTQGYATKGPYDRILVTAAAPALPEPLKEQLVTGGRIVIPLGDAHNQWLTYIDRVNEHFQEVQDIACRFVPLVGEHGWKHGG